MSQEPRPETQRQTAQLSIDAELLARAADVNDAVAGEFAEQASSPAGNPVIARMADLGLETEAAVSVALQRAHRIALQLSRARVTAEEEARADVPELSDADCGQVAGLAVAWWDGALTALRAVALERARRDP